MDIVKVYPRQVRAVLDISQEELNYLLDFLNACTVDYGKGEDVRKAGEFVIKDFFPKLDQLSKDLEAMK